MPANGPISRADVNDLRRAIDAAGGTPSGGWTDGASVTENTPVKAKHFTELKAALQNLWRQRSLGLIPNWTSLVVPGGESVATLSTKILGFDLTDADEWKTQYQSHGDLRGVHWFNAHQPSVTPPAILPKVGWNVESLFGVSNSNNTFNSTGVAEVLGFATAAYNYGMTNIIRMDWKKKKAVPKPGEAGYGDWKTNFWDAVRALQGVCQIFIVGNEPLIFDEGSIHSGDYANAYNDLYSDNDKVAGPKYLIAGPAAWSHIQPSDGYPYEDDLVWFASVCDNISATDGFAIHSYGSVEEPGCIDPRDVCLPYVPDGSDGDRGFRRYRNYAKIIREAKSGIFATKPVYITEFNTHGVGAADQDDRVPKDNYPTGFMQEAYEEVRNYNSSSLTPKMLALCWFVDAPDRDPEFNWSKYALSVVDGPANARLLQARRDFINSNTSTGI